jgi:hypothetical protein
LLNEARLLLPAQGIAFHECDLTRDLDAVFATQPDLVVTSALLDLVSISWLDQLIGQLVRHRKPFYAALSYDGRATCLPPHAADRLVLDAVNRHQKTDKGFGPALGPDAAAEAIARFEAAGFAVHHAASDWLFRREEGVVQSMVIDGWAQAVYEMGDIADETLSDWASWHLTRIADGETEMMVGHLDIFAVPKA